MATVDEILTRQAYAAGDGAWTKDNNYPSYTLYVEPEYVTVTNKRIADFNDQISVRGERNAQFVGFQMPRYDDGLDLTAAHLYIHYQTVYGGSDSIPCNVSWSDNHVRMCWQVPAQATQEPDRVQMMIYATGTNSAGERVTWKTLPTSYTIHDGLDIGGGIPEPDLSWYEQFVAQMEAQVSTAQGHANDAQVSKTAAAGSATAAAESATASAQALEDNKAYVESQKETFVGYNKRETDLKYANALIGTASGMGRVTVGDAWEAPIPDLEIAGMSGQFSTTGAQMLDIPSLSARTSNGVTFTPNPDGAILAAGTATGGNSTFYLSDRLSVPSGDYYISGCPDGGDKSTYVIKGYINTSDGTSYAYAYDIGDGDTLTVKDGQTLSLAITIGNNASGPLVFRPMLHAGSTPKPWEPYTGGQPSPSPDYPQPIISTGAVTTGAQLFDASKLVLNNAEAEISESGRIIKAIGKSSVSSTLSYKIDIKQVAGKTVYLQGDQVSKGDGVIQMQLMIKAADGKYRYATSNPVIAKDIVVSAAIATDDTGVELLLYCNKKSDDDNVAIYENVRVGIAKSAWEPYTGGKPSPSPDYPQTMDVTVTGAQLIDASKIPDRSSGGITVTNTSAGSIISGEGPITTKFDLRTILTHEETMGLLGNERTFTLSSDTVVYPYFFFNFYDKNGGVMNLQLSGTNQVTKTLPDVADIDTLYVQYGYFGNKDVSIVAGNQKVMLNTGPTALPWQPYQSGTASITLTEPLHGVGDYRDRIMCKDGEWGIERYISHYKLTSDIVSASSGGVTTTNNIIDNRYTVITCEAWKNTLKKELYENGKKTIGFCTIAPPGMINDWNTSKNGKENVYTINAAGAMYISIPISSLGITANATRGEVTAAVKQYVADNDVYVMFVLDTPTWEPLPSATQSALNALTTYTGTTHVTVTAGGPEPDVGMGYVQDTRAVVADLQVQIDAIRNGGTT